MRRRTLGLLAALAVTVGAIVAARIEAPRWAPRALVLASHVAGRVARLAVSPAWAADEMTFRRVAPESVGRIEDRVALRRASRLPSAPSTPPAPSASSVDTLRPITPAEPLPPDGSERSGDMTRVGSDIHIEKDQTVVGDVVAIGGDVTVDGHVKGDVTALRGDVYLSSTARVDGDVACIGGELHEDSGAFVGGQKVTALSGRRERELRHLLPVEGHVRSAVVELTKFGVTLAWLLVVLGLIWLSMRIAGGRTVAAIDGLRRETAASLGVGLLAIVLVIPSLIALCLVVAILCITIIGIPVALAALVAYALLLMLLLLWGFVVGAAWLGGHLPRGPGGMEITPMRAAVTGAVLIIGGRALGHLLHAVPGIGVLGGFIVVISWITSSLVGTLGAGALLRSEFATGVVGRWWRGTRTPRAQFATPGAPAPAAGYAAPPGYAPAPPGYAPAPPGYAPAPPGYPPAPQAPPTAWPTPPPPPPAPPSSYMPPAAPPAPYSPPPPPYSPPPPPGPPPDDPGAPTTG
jgi:hypothetical protein